MADPAAGIMKRLPLFGDEFPAVLPWRERELQHAERFPVPNLAVRSGETKEIMAASASPSNDFADSVRGIGFTLRVLWCKAFVGMFMSCKNQVAVGGVQVVPELLQLGMDRVLLEDTAAEERMMTIRQNARIRMFRKILFQPSLLRGAGSAAAQVPCAAICIQHDNMPVSQVVAIEALARWPRQCTPILEIARRRTICVLMIS